jgi:hypothetical protein
MNSFHNHEYERGFTIQVTSTGGGSRFKLIHVIKPSPVYDVARELHSGIEKGVSGGRELADPVVTVLDGEVGPRELPK